MTGKLFTASKLLLLRFRRLQSVACVALLACVVTLGAVRTASAQYVLQSGEMDRMIREGEDLMYDMSFDSANAKFDSAIALDPKFPAGFFYKAVVIFWRTTTNTDNTTLDETYNHYLDQAIERSDSILAHNDKSYPGIFYKGAALGYRAMILSQRKTWTTAIASILSDVKQGIKYMDEITEMMPGNSDLLVVRGIYNYYVEAIKEETPALAPIISLFAVGNKKIGLMMLEEAAKSATYSRIEAQYQLAVIYELYEHNHVRANAFAQHLAWLYPNNVEFLSILGSSEVSMGLTDRYDSTYRVILDRARNKLAGYTIKQARMSMYYIGQAELVKPNGNIDSALWFLYNSDLLSRKMSPDETNGWIIRAELLMGEAYDIKGMRDRAVEMYKRVASMSTGDDGRTAENFLKNPYRR